MFSHHSREDLNRTTVSFLFKIRCFICIFSSWILIRIGFYLQSFMVTEFKINCGLFNIHLVRYFSNSWFCGILTVITEGDLLYIRKKCHWLSVFKCDFWMSAVDIDVNITYICINKTYVFIFLFSYLFSFFLWFCFALGYKFWGSRVCCGILILLPFCSLVFSVRSCVVRCFASSIQWLL